MSTLRYTPEAPLQPRPHAPTVAQFKTYDEAADHLSLQSNCDLLEVVER